MNSVLLLRALELALCVATALFVSSRLRHQTSSRAGINAASIEEAQRTLSSMFRGRWSSASHLTSPSNRPPEVAETLRSPLAIVFLLTLSVIFAMHPDGTTDWLGSHLPSAAKSWALVALELISASFALAGVFLNLQRGKSK
jgi:hypothetical protein